MSISDFSFSQSETFTPPSVARPPAATPEQLPQAEVPRDEATRPLHCIAEVRRRQGVSLRGVSRQLKLGMRELRQQEQETTDLRLSDLYRWQQALEVPLVELLVDSDGPLSGPVMERARLVKIMKTAAAILESAEKPGVRRLAQTLVDQLIELMPELQGISAWHAVGQRRTLDEVGRAAEREISTASLYRYE